MVEERFEKKNFIIAFMLLFVATVVLMYFAWNVVFLPGLEVGVDYPYLSEGFTMFDHLMLYIELNPVLFSVGVVAVITLLIPFAYFLRRFKKEYAEYNNKKS